MPLPQGRGLGADLDEARRSDLELTVPDLREMT